MSFLAKLEMDGETMNVLECQCKLFQDLDKSGKPTGDPLGGVVRLILESSKSTLLFDWMVSTFQTKNGKITFFRRDAVSKMREMEFTDAYCISHDEMFNGESAIPMHVEILISAKEIIMNGTKYNRNWPSNG